jgi:hypothetical protein
LVWHGSGWFNVCVGIELVSWCYRLILARRTLSILLLGRPKDLIHYRFVLSLFLIIIVVRLVILASIVHIILHDHWFCLIFVKVMKILFSLSSFFMISLNTSFHTVWFLDRTVFVFFLLLYWLMSNNRFWKLCFILV